MHEGVSEDDDEDSFKWRPARAWPVALFMATFMHLLGVALLITPACCYLGSLLICFHPFFSFFSFSFICFGFFLSKFHDAPSLLTHSLSFAPGIYVRGR